MTNKNVNGFRNKLFIVLMLTLFLILIPAAVYAESNPEPSGDVAVDDSSFTIDDSDAPAATESAESFTSSSSETTPDSIAIETTSSDSEAASTEAPASESDDNHVDESSLIADGDCYVVELDVLDIADVNTEIDLQFTLREVGDSSIGEIDIEIPDGFTYVDNGITINDLYSTDWIGSYNSDSYTVNVSRNSGVDAIFSADDPISILFRVITPTSASDGHEFTTAVKDADGNNNDMHESSSQPVVNVRDGSESLPFEIGNPSQLDDVRNYLNGKHFIQTADIDLGVGGWADDEGWQPLGDSATKFSGNFDGNGYEISNLAINRSGANYQGLFGYADGAAISNLVLNSISVSGNDYTGALVGRADNSYLEDIHVTGDVTGNQYTGGLVGWNTGTITTSHAQGPVSGSGEITGGLVGINEGSITGSYATGSVTGENAVGGLGR